MVLKKYKNKILISKKVVIGFFNLSFYNNLFLLNYYFCNNCYKNNSLIKINCLLFLKTIKLYFKNWIYFCNIKKYAFIEMHVRFEKLYFLVKFFMFHYLYRFNYLLDLFAIDLLMKKEKRFIIVYNLLSFKFLVNLSIKLFINEFTYILSINNLIKTSIWLEREIYDMFGIIFIYHVDLRRILTDYGFWGFPLRKDYLVVGYFEYFFDIASNKIVNIPIKLTQNFKMHSFNLKWHK